MRFHSPDSLTTFDGGELSPYGYCHGDPINHLDPSGHLSWQAWMGIGLGAFGIAGALFSAWTSLATAGALMAALEEAYMASLIAGGLAVTADVSMIASGILEERHPELAGKLGAVAMVTGLGSMAGGLKAVLSSAAKTDMLAM
ncbi:hypothetical protein JZM24_09145 [Candidatus Sodalis endolongispinus]|uniref:Rhs family protein n=1 Tax=Candidatus Sodalis endolongispinus TaxID=2812662 RepID=A0ABS5YB46_9GAMM|nr:hypothetical protein [Candidatus Sodalis endolongispinus]